MCLGVNTMVAKRSIQLITSVLILTGVIHTATATTVNAATVNVATVNCTSAAYQNDRYCLKLGSGLKTWDEAEKECRQQGGHLAVIRDEETQNAVANVTDSMGWSRVWIGGKLEYNWRWASKRVQWKYSNWYLSSSDPDPENLNIQADDFKGCLSVGSGRFYGYRWKNKKCLLKQFMYSICENPIAGSSCEYRYEGRCFFIYKQERNWYDASKYCHGRRGHLAYIDTQEVQNTIEEMLENENYYGYYWHSYYFWIGGIYTADQWVWTTGEEIQSRKLFYSQIGFYNHYDLSYLCLEMRRMKTQINYKWDRTECSFNLSYTCQFEIHEISQPSKTNLNLQSNLPGDKHTTEISILAVLVGIEFIAIVILVAVLIRRKRKSQRAADLFNDNTYSMGTDNSLYYYATSDFGRTDDDKM